MRKKTTVPLYEEKDNCLSIWGQGKMSLYKRKKTFVLIHEEKSSWPPLNEEGGSSVCVRYPAACSYYTGARGTHEGTPHPINPHQLVIGPLLTLCPTKKKHWKKHTHNLVVDRSKKRWKSLYRKKEMLPVLSTFQDSKVQPLFYTYK